MPLVPGLYTDFKVLPNHLGGLLEYTLLSSPTPKIPQIRVETEDLHCNKLAGTATPGVEEGSMRAALGETTGRYKGQNIRKPFLEEVS